MRPSLLIATVALCLLSLATSRASAASSSSQCTFEILVKTGGRKNAGTDARVSLQVSGATGPAVTITNLESLGRMAAGHDYFERGNLDRYRCLSGEPCKLLIKSDGTGNKPGWYVEYVTVTQLRHGSVSSRQHKWAVDQWLALDEAPNQLFATRNGCGLAKALP
ncbi:hypothetical protein HU200_036174 [Digitaria exilis]|uniref:PLAT domain-containing protein n=1 Tax=Digitaria exilis TaxID=1010633 RepID=A0A835BSP0_9POAL|nr:hypothetical protein HU200_036174 [Digitaria exilis]